MSDSIFINLFLIFINKVTEILKESRIYSMLKSFGAWIFEDIKKSKFVKLIWKDEKASFYIKYSIFLQYVQVKLNKFSEMCREKYKKNKSLFESSVIFLVLNEISKNIVFALGIIFCIQMIIPEHLWHNTYNIIFIFLVLLLYLIKVTVDIRFNINVHKLDLSILAFMATVILGVFNSKFSIDSVRYLCFYASILVFGVVLVNSIRNKYAFMKFVRCIVIMSFLMCVYGICQIIMGIPVDPLLIDLNMGQILSRVYSTLGNPNIYAGVLVLVVPFCILMFLESSSIRERFFVAITVFLLIYNIALTYSRAAYVSVIVAIFTFLILKNVRLVPLVLILLILVIPLIPSDVITRLLTLGKDTSSTYRFGIWQTSIKMIKDNWFLGIGINMDNYKLIFTRYSVLTAPAHSHMFFLQIWLELGIFGIVTMFWIIIRFLKWALKVLFLETDKKMSNIIIANVSSLMGVILFGFSENIGFSLRILYMFWTVVILLVISLNISGKQYKKIDMEIVE